MCQNLENINSFSVWVMWDVTFPRVDTEDTRFSVGFLKELGIADILLYFFYEKLGAQTKPLGQVTPLPSLGRQSLQERNSSLCFSPLLRQEV